LLDSLLQEGYNSSQNASQYKVTLITHLKVAQEDLNT